VSSISPADVTQSSLGTVVVVLSGAGGANFRALEAKTGHILWESSLHDATSERLSEPSDAGTDIIFVPGTEDVVVLSNSESVRRISMLDGRTKWTWTADDSV
jgi:outer membrane protein assembly factor BamB